MHLKLAFIGFGVVGQGLTEILMEKKDWLVEKYDFHYSIVAISDIMNGSIYDKNGLDMAKILDLVKKGKKLDDYPTGIKDMNSLSTISKTNADTIIEVTLHIFLPPTHFD